MHLDFYIREVFPILYFGMEVCCVADLKCLH